MGTQVAAPGPVNRGGRAALAAGLVALAAGAAWWLHRPAARPADGTPRPNIVLFVWDTCRGDRVSVNGYARPTTPALAAFAAGGVTFRNCFTPSPLTPPAHASLFTGLLPRHHGLREQPAPTLAPGIPLLAETLKEAGYETAAVTANPSISQVTNLLRGFDAAAVRRLTVSGKGDAAMVLTWIEDWLRDRRAAAAADPRPLFLFVNLMETHLPLGFQEEDVARLRGAAALTPTLRDAARMTGIQTLGHLLGARTVPPEAVRALDAAYDGSVASADRTTATILGMLEKEGLLRDAFVAVTSDHGENLGEHGELEHRMSVYEPVLHVPLVVRWPGGFEGGRVEDAQVRLQDLYPTILEAARVQVPPPCGRDAVSLRESPLRPRTLVAEYGPSSGFIPHWQGLFPDMKETGLRKIRTAWVAVREPPGTTGTLKYIEVTYHPDAGAPTLEREELYDLAADPGETRNLLGPGAGPAEREAVDRLRRRTR